MFKFILFKFSPSSRDYTKWEAPPVVFDEETSKYKPVEIDKNPKVFDTEVPIIKHLLPGDIIDESGDIIESHYRTNGMIPGILVLSGKTYGRPPKKNTNHTKSSKHDKKYYKCIPHDSTFPNILIPYKEHVTGFSKHKVNMYVLFKYDFWRDKHPVGVLENVLGKVDDPINFYEYQLYSKNLMISIKNLSKVSEAKLNKIESQSTFDEILSRESSNSPTNPTTNSNINLYSLEDRTSHNIFSIDPANTKDIDDAMGITINRGNDAATISIYIANVPWWLNTLQLWEHLSKRVSTIYLPHKKIPMMPTCLSDGKMSLTASKLRPAFAMDIHIANNKIEKITFHNTLIKVTKNFEYEEPTLRASSDYKKINAITRRLIQYDNTRQYIVDANDSHDIVAYYMIMMNHECAKELGKHQTGIYRSVERTVSQTDYTEKIDNELKKFIDIWKHTKALYTTYQHQKGHAMIGDGLDKYIQITSPIRRMVDVVNMSLLQIKLGLVPPATNEAAKVFQSVMGNMEWLNLTMKHIRRVQTDCSIYQCCIDKKTNSEDTPVVRGYIIDIKEHDEQQKMVEYVVYIPSLKLTSTYKSVNPTTKLILYREYIFGMYLFTDESSLHRKVRIQPNVFSPE